MDKTQRMLNVMVPEEAFRNLFLEKTVRKAFEAIWENEEMSKWVREEATPKLNAGILVHPAEGVEYMVRGGVMACATARAVHQQIADGGKSPLNEVICNILQTSGKECVADTKKLFEKEKPRLLNMAL